MAETTIEWTATRLPDGTMLPGYSFNPWIGCTKISPACDHCYAEARAKRFGEGHLWQGERRRTSPANWKLPLKWNRDAKRTGIRRKVFCASLADVFDNQVPEQWRNDLWELIAGTRDLDWLLLTKRPQNIAKMLPVMDSNKPGYKPWNEKWPWRNVWFGTTVENQEEADRRIPNLLATPAAVRFLSCEPLLGPVDLTRWTADLCPNCLHPDCAPTLRADSAEVFSRCGAFVMETPRSLIDWVIAGGESGPGARPMHPSWARSLRDQCVAAGVPFFFKQWGEWIAEGQTPGRPVKLDPNRRRWADVEYGDDRYALESAAVHPVGKKSAGRLLDGSEHNDTPSTAA